MAGRASRGPAWFDHLAAEWREKVDRATEDWDQALSAVRRPLAISEDVAPEEDLEAGDNPSRQAGVRGIPRAMVVQAK